MRSVAQAWPGASLIFASVEARHPASPLLALPLLALPLLASPLPVPLPPAPAPPAPAPPAPAPPAPPGRARDCGDKTRAPSRSRRVRDASILACAGSCASPRRQGHDGSSGGLQVGQ